MSYLVAFEYLAVFDLLVEKIDFYFVDFAKPNGLKVGKVYVNQRDLQTSRMSFWLTVIQIYLYQQSSISSPFLPLFLSLI